MYTYRWRWQRHTNNPIMSDKLNPSLFVVGCGGTGSLVAEGLCRLLHGAKGVIYLVDYDRVEEQNLHRQNFYHEDLGEFKSQSLARRLARKYGRTMGYSVHPYNSKMLHELPRGFMHGATGLDPAIIIGCVDNPEARRSIADGLSGLTVWVDAGNGESSGQVLVGDTTDPEHLRGVFKGDFCNRMPAPSLQEPGLLVPVDNPRPLDCAVAVEQGDQSPVINQAMASLVLDVVWRLLQQKLTWLGVYLDLELGHLRPVPIAPAAIARLCRFPEKQLVEV